MSARTKNPKNASKNKGTTGKAPNVAARDNAKASNERRLADFFGTVRDGLADEIKAGEEMLVNGCAMMATGDTFLTSRGQSMAKKGASLVENGPKAQKVAERLADSEALASTEGFQQNADNLRALNLQAIRILGTINKKASEKIIAINKAANGQPIDLKKSAGAFKSLKKKDS